MFEKLKSIDAYGHPVGVLYKGNPSHNTCCGSILTICMAIFLLWFGLAEILSTLERDNQNVSSNKILVDLEEKGQINLADYDFNLMIWTLAAFKNGPVV